MLVWLEVACCVCVCVWAVLDVRFIEGPACQGAAERDQGLFDDLAAQLLPSRLFVEVCVVVEGGGRRGGVDVAWDGHGGLYVCGRVLSCACSLGAGAISNEFKRRLVGDWRLSRVGDVLRRERM